MALPSPVCREVQAVAVQGTGLTAPTSLPSSPSEFTVQESDT